MPRLRNKKKDGIDWKERHAGIARAMQFFCSEYKTEHLLNMGLDTLNEIEEKWIRPLFAIDPHKLVRSLEDLSILTNAKIILHASLARKASSQPLDFYRIDYPELDPPEWNKFITVKLENDKVKIGENPRTKQEFLKKITKIITKIIRGYIKARDKRGS